jgi:hypothetical protein
VEPPPQPAPGVLMRPKRTMGPQLPTAGAAHAGGAPAVHSPSDMDAPAVAAVTCSGPCLGDVGSAAIMTPAACADGLPLWRYPSVSPLIRPDRLSARGKFSGNTHGGLLDSSSDKPEARGCAASQSLARDSPIPQLSLPWDDSESEWGDNRADAELVKSRQESAADAGLPEVGPTLLWS